ncbi:hypothetical protein JOM56_013784, partial [Amanita muscaria]
DWGFEQQEVTCNNNVPRGGMSRLRVMLRVMPPDMQTRVNYKVPGSFSKFWEMQM